MWNTSFGKVTVFNFDQIHATWKTPENLSLLNNFFLTMYDPSTPLLAIYNTSMVIQTVFNDPQLPPICRQAQHLFQCFFTGRKFKWPFVLFPNSG